MTNAQDRGWGPHGGLGREDLLLVDCPGIPLRVRAEVAPLFTELVRWLTIERARTGVAPLRSAGGYNDRLISGTTIWSNHAWALAGDFNPDTNPYQRRFKSDMPPGTSAKAASLGMRWGGDYKGKVDPQHFEFMGTPADAAARVASLRAGWTKSRPGVIVTDRIDPQEIDMSRVIVIMEGKPASVWSVDLEAKTRVRLAASVLDLLPASLNPKRVPASALKPYRLAP